MSWSGLDQRVFPRFNTRCDIAIHGGPFGTGLKVKTQNLGAGGVCVILDQGLEKLSQVRMRLALASSEKPIECEGRVVWMVRSKEPASRKVSFDTGIEFLNLSSEDQARIKQFIQSPA
jgi:c-di-GMP-binding flagellar brake protein YcgR